MSFNDFVQKYNLKNKPSSNIKIQQVLSSIGLENNQIYPRDEPFSSNIRIVNLHPSKGTQWIVYIDEKYFDSYVHVPPRKLSKFVIKRHGHYLYSENKIRGLANKKDSCCAIYYLYIIYLTKVLRINFKSAVLMLYDQRFFKY